MTEEIRGSFVIYLIAEESAEITNLSMMLSKAGFRFFNVRCVEDALEKLSKNPPHICLVDFQNQNLNAEQYLEKFFRASPETLHIALLPSHKSIEAAIFLDMGFYGVVDCLPKDHRYITCLLDHAIERIYFQYQAEQIQEQSEKKIKELEEKLNAATKETQSLNEKQASQEKQTEELFQKCRSFQIRISELEAELEASEGKTQRYISEFVKVKAEKDALETQLKRYRGDLGTASLGFSGLMTSLSHCHSVEDAIQDWLNKIHRLYQDVPVAFFRFIPNHSHLVLSQCAGLNIQRVRGVGVPLAGLSPKEQRYFYSHVRFLANLRDLLKGAFNVSEFEFRELVTDRGVIGLCVIFKALKTDREKRFFNDSIELLNLVAHRNSLAFKIHEYDIKDELTGLLTRRSLDDSVAAEMSRAGRTQLPLSALYIRIDGFVDIEKKWEVESEKVIKAVATILRKTSRINDLLFRIEKDQFVALLPHTDLNGALVKAENLQNLIHKAQIRAGTGELLQPISVSVGISEYPSLCRDADGLLISADEALFEASRKGGNSVQKARTVHEGVNSFEPKL